MRFMDGDVADRAVIASLSDPENEVQQAAADTLRYRPIEGVLPAVEVWLSGRPITVAAKRPSGSRAPCSRWCSRRSDRVDRSPGPSRGGGSPSDGRGAHEPITTTISRLGPAHG